MEYVGRAPSPPLAAFVERIWHFRDTSPAPLGCALPRERVAPGGGTMALIVNLGEDAISIDDPTQPGGVCVHSGSVFSGPSTQSLQFDPRQRRSVVGAHFRPGGAYPFLGIASAELVDAHANLADLWGPVGRHLREQLLEVQAPSARIQVLENLLLARLRRARAGHPAVRVAVSALGASGNGARVAEVASSVGLSHRRFVELFEREVGLAPKLYARLQRFHAVKACLAQLDRPPEWATFALVWGYCDQSHMIRDFVAFSDLTPASYLRGRSGETRFEQMVHAFPNRQRAEGVRFIQYDDPSDT